MSNADPTFLYFRLAFNHCVAVAGTSICFWAAAWLLQRLIHPGFIREVIQWGEEAILLYLFLAFSTLIVASVGKDLWRFLKKEIFSGTQSVLAL